MVKERAEVPIADKWNVEVLYPSLAEWEEDLKVWGREGSSPHWPELTKFKGKLSESPEVLKNLLELSFSFDRHLSKLYTYAHLRHDEDVAQNLHKEAYSRITSLLHDYRQESAWIEPEILQIPESFLKSDVLADYKVFLEKILRLKPHMLSADKEELVALAGKPLEAMQRAFSAFNNADLKFPPVKDSKGELNELTHGRYQLYLRNKDRKLREESFKTLHKSFEAYENTICELINGQVQSHLFDARARKYSSCLEDALFPHQIDVEVYTSLIKTVRENLAPLHRYIALRKEVLGLSELHLYDLSFSLVPDVDITMDYDEAEKCVIESVGLLGPEYQETLKEGLLKQRWVDRFENARKRSGAYSSGCYDSMPYILMNYQGTLSDILTLAHEAGHSMHSFLSKENQPYQYAQYPIFVAEVASTFNEELLMRHLLEKLPEKKQKAYLINQKIDSLRSTLFRQAMFAEFELRLHEWAEAGVPLTPALLKKEYRKLNADYFGPDITLDEEIDIEWARIPHFYYNFYVYQYATGISAAHALVEIVSKGGVAAREKYLQFLSSGSSRFPIDLLKTAGVDMRQPDAIKMAIEEFDRLVSELAELTYEKTIAGN